MIGRELPEGVFYLNLGHSNATPKIITSFQAIPDARTFMFVHDVIPFDHPKTQSTGSAEKMQRIIAAASVADGVIFSAHSTEAEISRYLPVRDDQKRIVAPLGPFLPMSPPAEPADPPYFVAIGTIEPRKGYDLLFDVWESFAEDPPTGPVPHLIIIGTRGWASEKTFDRLEQLKTTGLVTELIENDDQAVARVLARASGLLFPSVAEGYGLPALEAATQGIVPITSDLPVFHEILGDIPVYVKSRDPYRWRTTILHVMEKEIQTAEQTRINALVSNGNLPTWEDHFNTVLTAIG